MTGNSNYQIVTVSILLLALKGYEVLQFQLEISHVHALLAHALSVVAVGISYAVAGRWVLISISYCL